MSDPRSHPATLICICAGRWDIGQPIPTRMQHPPATLYFRTGLPPAACIASISSSSSHLVSRGRRLHAALVSGTRPDQLVQRWLALDPSQRCICTTKRESSSPSCRFRTAGNWGNARRRLLSYGLYPSHAHTMGDQINKACVFCNCHLRAAIHHDDHPATCHLICFQTSYIPTP